MKITLELDLTASETQLLLTHSLERFMNTAADVGRTAPYKAKPNPRLTEEAAALSEDADTLKPLARKLWDATAEEVRKAKAASAKAKG